MGDKTWPKLDRGQLFDARGIADATTPTIIAIMPPDY
jgi:hypothetical protein